MTMIILAPQRGVEVFSIFAVILIGMTIFSANLIQRSSATQLQSNSASLPAGYPGNQEVSTLGNSLVPMIENNSQFRSLADGIPYHISPYSSFGFSRGPDTPSIVTIVFFSPNLSGQIEVDVLTSNHTIQHMYFDNVTLSGFRG